MGEHSDIVLFNRTGNVTGLLSKKGQATVIYVKIHVKTAAKLGFSKPLETGIVVTFGERGGGGGRHRGGNGRGVLVGRCNR